MWRLKKSSAGTAVQKLCPIIMRPIREKGADVQFAVLIFL
jgi:hypothetical protein